MQPRRSAPKERDNVTAARDPGPGNGHLDSQLATRLRSLAIILPIHLFYYHSSPRLQPYTYNYHTSAYKAEHWRTCPYKKMQHPNSLTLC